MIFEVPGSLFGAKNGSQIGSESHLRRGSSQKASWRPLGTRLEPKKQSWNRSWSALEASWSPVATLRILGVAIESQEASRALQERFPLCFLGSKSFQERSKRPPRGFPRPSASKMRFGSNFGFIFDSPKGLLDLKNQGNPLYCQRFRMFSLMRFWIQF